MTTNLDVLQGIADGVALKVPCQAATITDFTNSMIGLPIVDGYQLQPNDRLLVMANSDQTTNGIYTVNLSAWVRALDFSNSSSVCRGTLVLVNNGAVNGNATFYLATVGQPGTIVFGTSKIVFARSTPAAIIQPPLPTSPPPIGSGILWNDGGVVAIA